MVDDNRLKVSIIEDSEIHREWLKAELLEYNDLKLVSVDCLGRVGIESVKCHKPDLVLLDFQMQDMTGLEISKRLKNHNRHVKIFIITAHAEISIIQRIINDKNIDGFAIKGSPYFEHNLLNAIHYVVKGGTYLDPCLLAKLRESKNANGLDQLTAREFEVLIQFGGGKSDEKIAEDLCVEPAHVKNIKSKIMKKIKNDNINSFLSKLLENANPANHKLLIA